MADEKRNVVSAEYNGFYVESRYIGNKCWDRGANSKWSSNFNYHKVTVKNIETGKWTWFEFWQSLNEKRISNKEQLLEAFWCFLLDAQAGDNDYAGFCDEYGYNRYDQHSKQTYKKVRAARDKAVRVLGGMGEASDMLNRIQEEYNL